MTQFQQALSYKYTARGLHVTLIGLEDHDRSSAVWNLSITEEFDSYWTRQTNDVLCIWRVILIVWLYSTVFFVGSTTAVASSASGWHRNNGFPLPRSVTVQLSWTMLNSSRVQASSAVMLLMMQCGGSARTKHYKNDDFAFFDPALGARNNDEQHDYL